MPEQLSGSPFTAPRASNERSWLYRIQPSVKHMGQFRRSDVRLWRTAPCPESDLPIAPLRWSPVPIPAASMNFVEGMHTATTAGDAASQSGMAAHLYLATRDMADDYFTNADGELLILPQQGGLRLRTEFGIIEAGPGQIAVIPRGVKFAADLLSGPSRGYVCENYGSPLHPPRARPHRRQLPGKPTRLSHPCRRLRRPRSPLHPHRQMGRQPLGHRPLALAARTSSPGTATTLPTPTTCAASPPSARTCSTTPTRRSSPPSPPPTGTPGTANVDFVIFPDRWAVAENTFRPPWYHLNIMSEFMGLLYGAYDAKPQGFTPGGFSLHNSMLPHGPDTDAFAAASAADLKPHKLEGTMAFMFETHLPQMVTAWAANLPERQPDYARCWEGLARRFDPSKP